MTHKSFLGHPAAALGLQQTVSGAATPLVSWGDTSEDIVAANNLDYTISMTLVSQSSSILAMSKSNNTGKVQTAAMTSRSAWKHWWFLHFWISEDNLEVGWKLWQQESLLNLTPTQLLLLQQAIFLVGTIFAITIGILQCDTLPWTHKCLPLSSSQVLYHHPQSKRTHEHVASPKA